MKRTLSGSLTIGLLAFSCAYALKVHAVPREVHVEVGQLYSANMVLEMLARTFQRDKKSPRFRVAWHYMGSLGGTQATALYDRQDRTLKFYSYSDYLISEEPVKRERILESYLYRGVNDTILNRLKVKNKQADAGGLDGFFSQLPLLGCRKKTLRYKVTYWTPK